MFKLKNPTVKRYKIAFDNVKTIDDVIAVLKALDVTFIVDADNMTQAQKEAIWNGVIVPESVDKSKLN